MNLGLLLVPASYSRLMATRAVTNWNSRPRKKTFDGRDIDPMDQQQREQLRSEYKLRPLRNEEEGTGLNKLPNGVYGFTYAPATETPLFVRKSYHSFEVHKTSDGGAYIVAFVNAADAERIREREEDIDVTVYPDPYEDATTMVTISFDRVLTSLYKPVRYEGNAVHLKQAAV
jgi:hypothetical protein